VTATAPAQERHGTAGPGTGPTNGAARFLGVAEAAELAGVGARAIRRALHERRLAGQQIDGRWVVDADALEAYRHRVAERASGAGGTGRAGTARAGAGPGSGNGAEPVPADLYRELLHRHEAAVMRLGQLEAEAERLRERVRVLEAGEPEPEAPPEVATSPPEPEAPPPEARRPWWAPWRR
jgi:hypothetical protein